MPDGSATVASGFIHGRDNDDFRGVASDHLEHQCKLPPLCSVSDSWSLERESVLAVAVRFDASNSPAPDRVCHVCMIESPFSQLRIGVGMNPKTPGPT